MFINRSLIIVGIAIATFLTGCATPLASPNSPKSSMAIIQPIVSGYMRAGLAFNNFSYHENPSKVSFLGTQNRVICPDVKNKSTGEVFNAYVIFNSTPGSQCYYPNLSAGTYTFNDYKFEGPGETYRVLLIQLSNTLLFSNEELKFQIGSGEVKHLGKFVIFFKSSGGDLVIDHIDKLDAHESITQAKLDLERAEARWKLK